MKQPLLVEEKKNKDYQTITIKQGPALPNTSQYKKSPCIDPTTLYSIIAYACATASAALYAINNDSEQEEIKDAAIILMIISAMFRFVIIDLAYKADAEWLGSKEYRHLRKRMLSFDEYKVSQHSPLGCLVLMPLNHLMAMTNKSPLTCYMSSPLENFQHHYYIICTAALLWSLCFPKLFSPVYLLLAQHWWNAIDGLTGPYQMISNVFETRYKKSGSYAKSSVTFYKAWINCMMLIKSSCAIYNSTPYNKNDYWLFSLSMLGGLIDNLSPAKITYVNRVWEKKYNYLNQKEIKKQLNIALLSIDFQNKKSIEQYLSDIIKSQVKKEDSRLTPSQIKKLLEKLNVTTEYNISNTLKDFPLLFNNDQTLYRKHKKGYENINKNLIDKIKKILDEDRFKKPEDTKKNNNNNDIMERQLCDQTDEERNKTCGIQ
jgi:hypothetical protein